MSNVWRHFQTVYRHRWIVFRLMCKCGYPWRGLMHDLSKYSPIEFLPSARYFQGDKSPIEAEKAREGYSAAWLHHKGHNPHHWEYWIDFGRDGKPIPAKIPFKYVIEMICDYVAAGMTYSKERWTQSEPLTYFDRVRKGRHFHPDTEKLIRTYLNEISKRGVDVTCNLAKRRYYDYPSEWDVTITGVERGKE